MKSAALTIAVSLVAVGCATSSAVVKVPPRTAFAEPIDEVLARYPEAAPIFPEHARTGAVGTVPANALVAAWGAPLSKKTSMWSLWPGNWLYGPQSVWTWRLEGHRVECGVEQPLTRGLEAIAGDCRVVD